MERVCRNVLESRAPETVSGGGFLKKPSESGGAGCNLWAKATNPSKTTCCPFSEKPVD